ncbi:Translation initiation factor 3 subunit b [Podila horticola]|nr:Translation initiation factor 3 subunit b [Podila horticola]
MNRNINYMANAAQTAFHKTEGYHSCCSIIPPHVLRHISGNNRVSAGSRAIALKTLGHISVLHGARTTAQRAPPAGSRARTAVRPAANAQHLYRMIYNSHKTHRLPGSLLFLEGHVPSPADDESAKNIYAQFKQVFDFYHEVFHRNSIDNNGMNLVGSVHFDDDDGRTPGYDNAFFNGTEMAFGDGDGELFGSFTNNLDITGHELTHGVTQHTANLPYEYQAGALNESISDVFGSMIKQFHAPGGPQKAKDADWLIGKDLWLPAVGPNARALRDMANPGTAYNSPLIGKDPQPATMDGYVVSENDPDGDFGGVHTNSGIPNRAFFLAATSIGGYSWEVTGRVWYASLTDPDLQDVDTTTAFKTFADLTCKHAQAYGPKALAAVKKAWTTVGVY